MTEQIKPSQPPELRKEMDTRRLYFEAMAVSLGASEINIPVIIDPIIDRIFESRDSLKKTYNAQGSSEKGSLDDRVESNNNVRSLGKLFLSECEHSDQLDVDDYSVGTWALRLLFEDEAKGTFSNFPGKVEYWAGESAAKKFEEYVTKHKSDCKTI